MELGIFTWERTKKFWIVAGEANRAAERAGRRIEREPFWGFDAATEKELRGEWLRWREMTIRLYRLEGIAPKTEGEQE